MRLSLAVMLCALAGFASATEDFVLVTQPEVTGMPLSEGVVASADAISIPRILSYQGKLTDTLGIPVPDTTYSVLFRLYTQPTGGSHYWEETQVVRTEEGLFSVLLGSEILIPTVPDAGNLYLGMRVGADAEMTPRLRVVSAAYAYKADSADYAAAAAPTGTAGGDLTGTYPDPLIDNGAVTTSKLYNLAVTDAKLANGAVTAEKLSQMGAGTGQVLKWTGSVWAPRNDSVGTGGTGTVTSVGHGTGVVCSPNPITTTGTVRFDLTWGDARFVNEGQANAVTSSMIQSGAVTVPDIADTNVTMAKIAQAGAETGEVIKWTGSVWEPGPDNTGGGSGVTDVYQATGVICTPNPITSTGTVGFDSTWGHSHYVNEGQSASGDLTGTYPSPSLATSGVPAGTYGSATQVGQFTVDAKGRLTSAGDVSINVPPSGTAGGDLGGTYPNPTVDGLQGRAVASAVPSANQVLKWSGSEWSPQNDSIGGERTWTRGTPDSVLFTVNRLGIARGGADNMLYGNNRHTHVNFGVACTTGASGPNYFVATVSGGYQNVAGGDRSTVGGGSNNSATGSYTTISGGSGNTASDHYATVGGGLGNAASGYRSTVGGGSDNTASYDYTTVGGGSSNTASYDYATVAGGSGNEAGEYCAVVGGGSGNEASEYCTVVGGGYQNEAIETYAAVGGGSGNIAGGEHACVAGGRGNAAEGDYAFAGGGLDNTASYDFATVGGGSYNVASEDYATVPGGYADTVTGYYSFATNNGSHASYDNSAAFNGQATTASGQTRVGMLSKASGSFTIDHPLDPYGKILNHYFIEGPEMRNVYEGEVVLDGSGRAEVRLPDYFEALNRNPHVQLTGVGTFEVYVAEEVMGNRLTIGGKPGTKVFWTVTGERKDVSAEATRRMMPVEQPKTGKLASRMLDDEFISGCMGQLESEGKAQGIGFRTAGGRQRYEKTKRLTEESGR